MEVIDQLHALAAFPSGKQPPGTHGIGGSVDPKAGLDVMEKTLLPSPGMEP
jgi:hypothetical protein